MNLLPLLLLIAAPQTDSFAVVIGENRPINAESQPLAFADDDAIMTHQLLSEAGVNSSLLVRIDDDSASIFGSQTKGILAPTRAALRAALDVTFEKIRQAQSQGRRTRFYFVYSGHGDVADGEGYVALEDGQITRTYLHEEILARSPADENHVIIDACRSYFLVFGKGPGGQRRGHNLVLKDTRDRFPNTGFVLSTSSDRDSHEWARFRAGIFSHEVRSGLRGGADVNLDARISYSELGAFVETANKNLPNPRYRPDSVILPPLDRTVDADILLFWEKSDTLLVTDEASLGHMVLEDELGVRLADAHPAPGQTLLLQTPSSRPLFLRDFDNAEEYIIQQNGRPVVLSERKTHPTSVTSRGPAHFAFRLLFSAPFNDTTVRAFERHAAIVQFSPQESAREGGLLSATHAAAPWVALGAALVGGALTTAAVLERSSASQAEVDAANARITNFNRGAVGAYSVSVVSGLVWLSIELFGAEDHSPENN